VTNFRFANISDGCQALYNQKIVYTGDSRLMKMRKINIIVTFGFAKGTRKESRKDERILNISIEVLNNCTCHINGSMDSISTLAPGKLSQNLLRISTG